MEQHLLESGQVLQTHVRTRCIGQWCAIHQPMPGPWASWPRLWIDETVTLYRICPCSTLHPVAEMWTWAIATGNAHQLHHDCCGIHPCTPIDGGTEWDLG